MKFTKYDLGQRNAGEIVEVRLSGNAANVRLLDYSNLMNYQNGRPHRGTGGLAKKSPVRLQIPHSGHWYVVVDLLGLGGSTKSSIRVLPSPLPEIRERPLSSVPSLVRQIDNADADENVENKSYDVFISYASEDKDGVASPLAHTLRDKGLTVWFDEFEMKIGDSLRRKIDKGLAGSRFGIVILSQYFLKKGWTNYELDGIITRSITGEQVVLPIWHNISKQEVINFSPSLADKLARNTAMHTLEEIAEEICEVISSG
jgi:hypothetical protein